MKIAVVSDDEATISRHFGRAPYYIVLTIEEGRIVGRETRAKAGHHTFGACHCHAAPGEPHGRGPHSDAKHQMMAESIDDCDAVIAGGMGWGAFESLRARGIEPVITDERDVAEAALAFWSGALPNLMERLH
jgi:predicted Fe-Mo cluster-binding NifX family protein